MKVLKEIFTLQNWIIYRDPIFGMIGMKILQNYSKNITQRNQIVFYKTVLHNIDLLHKWLSYFAISTQNLNLWRSPRYLANYILNTTVHNYMDLWDLHKIKFLCPIYICLLNHFFSYPLTRITVKHGERSRV